ncbi:MAG: hypothetical protein LBL80_05320 [Ruminococcus sp.]|jgi:hypothetical protein|nr:hypothetical protein [Ruminococcus sp.]
MKKINLSKRGKINIGIIAFALLWCLLWAVFPLQWNALFMADMIGSNIYVLAFCFVSAFLSQSIFGAIWKINFRPFLHTLISAVFLVGTVYIYSIFFYSNTPWIILIYIVLTAVPSLLIIGRAKPHDSAVKLPLIKRKPVLTVAYALLMTFLQNFLCLLIFVMSKNMFTSTMR